ncbi:MAG: M23 family metallopeptidase, partial [Actinomycetota bacterium]
MSDIGAVIGRIQSIQSQISQIESLAQSGFAELLANELSGSPAGSPAGPGGLAPADAASVATLERSLSVGAGTRTEGFVRPVSGPVTSDYGVRTHPISGSHSHHDGIDFGAPMGTPIKAASGGTVSFVGWINGYGNVVIVDHGAGMQTFYAHQSKTLASKG